MWPELTYAVPELGPYAAVGVALSNFIQALISGNWSQWVSNSLDPLGIGFGDWFANAFGLGGRPKLGAGSATEDLIRYWARSLNPAIQLYSLRWAQLMQRGIPYSVSGGTGLPLRLRIDAELHQNLIVQGFALRQIQNFFKVSAHSGSVVNLVGQKLSVFDTPPSPVVYLPPPPQGPTCPAGTTLDPKTESCVPNPPPSEAACLSAALTLWAALKEFPALADITAKIGAAIAEGNWLGVIAILGNPVNELRIVAFGGTIVVLFASVKACVGSYLPPPPPGGGHVGYDPIVGEESYQAGSPIPTPLHIPLPTSAIAVTACGCGATETEESDLWPA
jgi:hypothetical protein